MGATLDWKCIKEEKPAEGRILVYSPTYPVGDSMRYRIIDSSFLSICKEVTHWCELTNPKNKP